MVQAVFVPGIAQRDRTCTRHERSPSDVIVPKHEHRFVDLGTRLVADPLDQAAPSGFSVRVVHLEHRRRSPHLHPHSQEAIYVVRGEGLLWEDGVARPFGAGDCALIEAGVPHATVPHPGTDMELLCFFPHPDPGANTRELGDVVIPESEDGAGRS
jgi:quercetin dioxygenase-like cupin family protein